MSCRSRTTRQSSAAGSPSSGARTWTPAVIDELAAPDIRFEHSLHQPLRSRDQVREFATGFRAAFPDLNSWGTADLIAEGAYIVGQGEGGGTHTGDATAPHHDGSPPQPALISPHASTPRTTHEQQQLNE
ncbi:ester cyclase [Gordonia asplenii]|uniref:ester cyclase n=1 Tax=Gordonia asplenii TaxID=2725283 RepID=UPI0035E43C4A